MKSRMVGVRMDAKTTQKLDLTLEEKRRRFTLEALADVDAGRTLEHSQVELWMSALEKPKRGRGPRTRL
jgi:hypothetical protein